MVRVNAAPAAAYPVVTITSPRIVPGQFSAPQVGATANLAATATDAVDGDISANIKWNEYLGTAGVMTTIGTGATASYTFTTAGDTFIVACVTNSSGLRNSMGVPYIVKAASGSTAPTVAITSPADGSTVASSAVQTFTGTATDAVEGNIASRLAWGSSIDGPLGYGASFTNFLSAGSHVITAVVTNAAGLTGTHSHSVTVTGSAPPPPPANYAPIVTIVQPSNGLSVPAGTAVTCVGTASDAEDGDISANIVWSDNVAGGLGKGASATYTPAAGTHAITAQAADSAGAVSADTHTLTVTSAGTPLTVTVAANKAAYVNKEKAYITTTVRQGAVAVSGATVTVQVRSGSRSVTTKTGTTTAAGTFAFYLPIQKSKYGSGSGPFTATVTANAAKTGYVSGTGSTTFLVY